MIKGLCHERNHTQSRATLTLAAPAHRKLCRRRNLVAVTVTELATMTKYSASAAGWKK
jgi:hypothetical protein